MHFQSQRKFPIPEIKQQQKCNLEMTPYLKYSFAFYRKLNTSICIYPLCFSYSFTLISTQFTASNILCLTNKENRWITVSKDKIKEWNISLNNQYEWIFINKNRTVWDYFHVKSSYFLPLVMISTTSEVIDPSWAGQIQRLWCSFPFHSFSEICCWNSTSGLVAPPSTLFKGQLQLLFILYRERVFCSVLNIFNKKDLWP